jgi:hypothetical protein
MPGFSEEFCVLPVADRLPSGGLDLLDELRRHHLISDAAAEAIDRAANGPKRAERADNMRWRNIDDDVLRRASPLRSGALRRDYERRGEERQRDVWGYNFFHGPR